MLLGSARSDLTLRAQADQLASLAAFRQDSAKTAPRLLRVKGRSGADRRTYVDMIDPDHLLSYLNGPTLEEASDVRSILDPSRKPILSSGLYYLEPMLAS